MTENEIAKIFVDCAFKIHKEIGPGLLESVYKKILFFELTKRDLQVQEEVGIKIIYNDITFDEGFRADLIVENKVIIELKSVELLAPVHFKQLLTYLRLTNKHLGILINFNENLIKNGIHRIVNNLSES